MDAGHSLFWRGYARVYDRIWDSPLTRSINTRALTGLGLPGTVVDMGCGTGLNCELLGRQGWDVIGVDTCSPMLTRAAGKDRVATTINADAASTGLPDDCAEVAVVSNILHIHPDPYAVLEEASRLIRKSGTIVCVWPAESLSFGHVFATDVKLGRSLGASLLAAVLRILVGLAGASVAARQRSSTEVARIVHEWAGTHGMGVHDGDCVMGVEEIAHLVQPCS